MTVVGYPLLGVGATSVFGRTGAVVAAQDDYTPEQVRAQHVYNVVTYGADPTGVADSTTSIQNAINALPTTGGVVYFPAGTYKITAPLNIGNGSASAYSTRYGVTLLGAAETNAFGGTPNAPAVVISSNNGQNSIINVQGPLAGWGIENIELNGNVNTTYGIKITSGSAGKCRHVLIQDCGVGIGMACLTGSGALLGASLNCSFHRFQDMAIYMPATVPASLGGTIVYGMTLDSNAAQAISNTSDNTFDTFFIYHRSPTTVTAYGIYLKGADNNRFENIFFFNFTVAGSNVIRFDYGGNVSWPSDHIFDHININSTQGYASLFVNSGAPGSGTTPNRVVNATGQNLAPVNPNLANLIWSLTDGAGTATIGAGGSSVVVTHSLGFTPTQVLIECTSNPGLAVVHWVDTITATQFTIHTQPAVTNQTTFAWRANL